MNKNPSDEYERIEEEEKELTFSRFSRADALNLGLTMIETAKSFSHPVAVEITLNGLVVFRYFADGAMADSELWLDRKRRSVNLMSMSSLRFRYWLEMLGLDLEKRKLDSRLYADVGGGYPINIEGTGMVGSICISGLPDHLEDHMVIVRSIRRIIP